MDLLRAPCSIENVHGEAAMDKNTIDHLASMASVMNALCNAIRSYDPEFAIYVSEALKKTAAQSDGERTRTLCRQLIDVLEADGRVQ